MAEIADFQIFWDKKSSSFDLTSGRTSFDISYSLPPNISPLAGGVVAFTVRASESNLGAGPSAPSLVKLTLSSNNKKIKTYELKTGTPVCSLVAFIHTEGQLKAGPNTLRFEIPDTLDSVNVSHVVLWFQRNV